MKLFVSGRIPSKKNSKRRLRRGNRTFTVPSLAHESWHGQAFLELRMQCAKKVKNVRAVSLSFWFKDNAVKDLTNAAESIMDLLVDYGVLEDDCWQKTGQITLIPLGIDKKNPGCQIHILEEPDGKEK